MIKKATDDMDNALRSLDAAPETSLTEAERQHSDDTFTRIVTSSADVPPAQEPARLWRRWRRLVPLGALAAAGTTAAALTFGGASAFASWTAEPEPLTSTKTVRAADTCRAKLNMPDSDHQTLLAERRGGWTYVFISAPVGEATCLMRNASVGQEPEGHEIFADLAEPTPTATANPNEIVEYGSTAASTDGGWFRKKGWLTWTYGYAGNDVKSVTVRTPLGTDVEATVKNGRFAAWWPSERPSSKNPEVMGEWRYTVTLNNGSTGRVTG